MPDLRKGLAIEQLIGAPLRAVVEANSIAIEVNQSILKKLVANQDDDSPNTFDICFDRPCSPTTDDTGSYCTATERVSLSVPMLCVIPISNLQVDEVEFSFSMEIKNISRVNHEEEDVPCLIGTVSCPRDVCRKTDSSAKYELTIRASDHGITEGMARIIDILNSRIAPSEIKLKANPASENVDETDSKKSSRNNKRKGFKPRFS